MLRRLPTVPVTELVKWLECNRSANVSDANFRSSVVMFRGVESYKRLIVARHIQILTSAPGPAPDSFQSAMAQIIAQHREKLARPEACSSSSSATPSTSADDTLNYSYELSEHEDPTPLVPYSDSESE